jgi:hypothetical protein
MLSIPYLPPRSVLPLRALLAVRPNRMADFQATAVIAAAFGVGLGVGYALKAYSVPEKVSESVSKLVSDINTKLKPKSS